MKLLLAAALLPLLATQATAAPAGKRSCCQKKACAECCKNGKCKECCGDQCKKCCKP